MVDLAKSSKVSSYLATLEDKALQLSGNPERLKNLKGSFHQFVRNTTVIEGAQVINENFKVPFIWDFCTFFPKYWGGGGPGPPEPSPSPQIAHPLS